LLAKDKSKIIENLNTIETLNFEFVQISYDKKEKGICFLKRPHFLKCIYKDQNEKELIVNRGNLVIYHKKYNKSYFYPVSKSYFMDILDKKKFKDLVLKGDLRLNNKFIELKYNSEKKGEIIFFFNKEKLDLSGWKITDLNGNHTVFSINNLIKNPNLDKKLFNIPGFN
tara:strand:+ start:301 stop:807 length:507 start_codon:yes stop_codon:yes gene_type:complete